ncbi:MAG: DAK2 domain-containing protein [Chloroflexi bacterium]|nr:DAK2 domain-containing protein [Chloroflexota bacterium]
MSQFDLAQLWKTIARSAAEDRDYLNDLDDIGNGNAGDNYQSNMQLVASTLEHELQGGQGDVGRALLSAAERLRADGRGATAPVYASGLADAGQRLLGRSGLSAADLLPLLEGLLNGAQGSSAIPQGGGGLLDALVPGVLGYLGAKQRGASDMEALMDALTNARRGTYSTRRESPPVDSFGQRDTTGQIDPGAAGIGSLFEGLLRGWLQQQTQPQQAQPQQTFPPQPELPQTPTRPRQPGGFGGTDL